MKHRFKGIQAIIVGLGGAPLMICILLGTDILPPLGKAIGLAIVFSGILNGLYEAWKLSKEEDVDSH